MRIVPSVRHMILRLILINYSPQNFSHPNCSFYEHRKLFFTSPKFFSIIFPKAFQNETLSKYWQLVLLFFIKNEVYLSSQSLIIILYLPDVVRCFWKKGAVQLVSRNVNLWKPHFYNIIIYKSTHSTFFTRIRLPSILPVSSGMIKGWVFQDMVEMVGNRYVITHKVCSWSNSWYSIG